MSTSPWATTFAFESRHRNQRILITSSIASQNAYSTPVSATWIEALGFCATMFLSKILARPIASTSLCLCLFRFDFPSSTGLSPPLVLHAHAQFDLGLCTRTLSVTGICTSKAAPILFFQPHRPRRDTQPCSNTSFVCRS
jgi:hypothetical protein